MDIPFLIILLFALFILLRLEFIFYIVYVLFGTWILSRWWANRSLRYLQTSRLYPDHAFLGEKAQVEVQISNRSWLPVPWLRVSEPVPLALHYPNSVRRVVGVGAHGQATLTYTLDCRQRGYYALGPISLNTGDLFGFSETQGQESLVDHITVYPRIIPLESLGLTSKLPFGTLRSRQRLFEDPSRMSGVRSYQAGDPLHRVHWKASAHSGDLLVTKLDAAISLETAILLNLNASEYDAQGAIVASEWAIVVAASIARHLAERRQPIGLLTNGKDPIQSEGRIADILPHAGRHHLMKVLEMLARVELTPTPHIPFVSWVRRATLGLGWGATVIVITPRGDEITCRSLHPLQRAGLNVVLIAVEPTVQFGQVVRRARSFGFPAYLVAYEEHLERWRTPRAPV